MKTLRLILGDQLNANHSWFVKKDPDIIYVIAELHQETHYVKHHIQKICAFFLAMEAFAKALQKAGHQVIYLTLDETKNYQDLPQLLQHLCVQNDIYQFEYQRPDEFRLWDQLNQLDLDKVAIQQVETEHFLLPFDELNSYFSNAKHTKMEVFYRKMRQRFNILMDENKPEGGRWNYDADNRKALSQSDRAVLPEPKVFNNCAQKVLARIDRHNVRYFGDVAEQLIWPITRSQALTLLNYFCENCLPDFGRFQDAMTRHGDSRWSLYHSRLSFALNAKILHPMQVIKKALQAFESSPGKISVAQIEGFIRQILGWREYIRGVYWLNMPEYGTMNHLAASNQLPSYFWDGNCKMACLKHSLGQSLEYAYAHHIQRLMIIGNFCLLAGIDPDAVDQWYLGVYIDAIEWVEMPNTRGMSQYADGGKVATKPYAASGNYVNKMSDYCSECEYKVKEKTSSDACPLNSLYWHFMLRHREELAKNHRIGMIYRNWDKKSGADQKAMLERAEYCLNHIESL